MKTTARSCLAAVSLILVCGVLPSRADYSNTVGALNPLAYWRFNETATSPVLNQVTNASTMGSALNGNVVLDATKGQPGIVGNSVRFINTGVAAGYCGSKVDVPFNFALNKSGAFSVECWVKPNALGGDGTGMAVFSSMMNDFAGSSRVGYLMYINNAGRFEWRLGNAGGYVGTVNNTANPAYNAATNVWRHVVCIFDGTQTRIFVNGVNVANATLSAANIASLLRNSQMPFRIGGTPFNGNLADGPWEAVIGTAGNRGFDGWVDEVAYYSYVLTTNQCAAHFAAATTNTAGYSAQILADNPTGYWPMNDPATVPPSPATFPVVANSGSVGSQADGTVVWGGLAAQSGAGYTGFGAGNNAVLLDGANGYIALTNAPGLSNITGNITLMAWVKPSVKNGYRDIIAHGWDGDYAETFLRIARGGGFGTTNFYEVGVNDGGAGAYNDVAQFRIPEGDIGNWVFLAGTYDGANWNLYRNGSLVASIASPNGAIAVTNRWSIGSRNGPPSPTSFFGVSTLNEVFAADGLFFGGSIDEPAIFNTALSAANINNIYNAAEVPPVITRSVATPNGYANATWPLLFKGRSTTLSVWAEGSPTLGYRWFSNGIPLGVTTTNLNLTDMQIGTPTYSVVVTNVYGSATSSVTLNINHAAPFITVQPIPLARFAGTPFSFSATAGGSLPMGFLWRTNDADIPGTSSSGSNVGNETVNTYGSVASLGNAFNYTAYVTNAAGGTTSAPAALLVFPAASGYSASVLGNSPIAYWRLGEASGTTAYDYIGANNGTYFNTTLNQDGYSSVDSNRAAVFSGDNSYVGLISGTAINFEGTNVSFTLECWANGPEGQPDESSLIAKGTGAEGTTANEQFALDIAFGHYRFLTRGNASADIYSAEATVGPNGTWQHVVGVYDQSDPATPRMRIYVNGELSGSGPGRPPVNNGLRASTAAVSIGSKRLGNAPVYDGTFSGTIDEVAIYGTALSEPAIQAQYGSAYGPNTPPQIALQPKSVTNYASLNATFSVGAFGSVPLTYQWKKGGTDIPGETGTSFTVNSLTAGDAGNYSVAITNAIGFTNSAVVTLTVLAIPTSEPAIPGLVLHLPFENNLTDATGRGNNGIGVNQTQTTSNTVTPSYVAGQLGQALHYQSDFGPAAGAGETTTTNTTYVTLGVRPDLQFGSNVNFTVAFWIRLPLGYIAGDLPIFTTTAGSLGGQGFVFSPAYGYGNGSGSNPDTDPLNYGGWGMSLYDDGGANGARVYGELGSINDGNWHHLVFVFERNSQVVTYLNGSPAKSFKISGTTTAAAKIIDTGLAAVIGQDPTGLYAETGSGDIDDLGVWKKALTPLEAASLYVAGINNLSFVIAPLGLITIERVGSDVRLTWSLGALQSADTVNGGYTDVLGASSPYTVAPSAAQKYYRLRP